MATPDTAPAPTAPAAAGDGDHPLLKAALSSAGSQTDPHAQPLAGFLVTDPTDSNAIRLYRTLGLEDYVIIQSADVVSRQAGATTSDKTTLYVKSTAKLRHVRTNIGDVEASFLQGQAISTQQMLHYQLVPTMVSQVATAPGAIPTATDPHGHGPGTAAPAPEITPTIILSLIVCPSILGLSVAYCTR